MKKRIITLITVFCLTMSMLYGLAYAKEEEKAEKKEVCFFSRTDNEMKVYLLSNTELLDSLAEDVREFYGVVGDISFGTPISVRNIPMYPESDSYYIPMFNNSECVAVINIGVDPFGQNGGYCVSMTKGFAEVFNTLSNGTYYFEYDADDMAVYLIGENTEIMVETHRCIDEYNNIATDENIVEIEQDEKSINLYDDTIYSSIDDNNLNRSEVTVTLNIGPIPQNSGYYCWLCCAAEISEYYGSTGFNLYVAHVFQHPMHTLSNCTGGTINDIKSVVNKYGHKQGTATGALLAHNTAISIGNQKPICSIWYCSGASIDHGMNIIGYKYDTVNNNYFKYVLHDSDIPGTSNPRIIASTYNATSVSFSYGGNTYTWSNSIYNWS